MKNVPDYILVLEEQPSYDAPSLSRLLQSWRSPLVVARSPAQALDSIRDMPPCLVILIGNHRQWPRHFSHQLRVEANSRGCTILALTEAAAPNWPDHNEPSIFDGFLVKPLSSDVLDSVLQAAQARKAVARSAVI